MATWKRILVEGDVTGGGVITVSSTAPHNVTLGDPVATTTAISATASDDKLLIWDESASTWNYVNYSNVGLNLGNSNLTQSDTNRTFDIANGGTLSFIGNNGAEFIIKSENSSGTEKVRTTIGEAIEAFSDSGQSFGGLMVSSFTTSATKKYGIWLEGGYTSSDAASAPNLIAFERIYDYDVHAPAANDEIATLEFYSATTTSQGTSSSNLQSNYNGEAAVYAKILTGISNPATAAYAGFIELGSYKVVTLSNSTTTGEFAPALRVDEIGVKINPKVTLAGTSGTPVNTNNDFYLPINRGTNGQVLTTNGSGATSWQSITAGSGYVDVSGTPANTQIAVFSDADTILGDADLTWVAGTNTLRVTDGFVAVDGVDFDTTTPPSLITGRLSYDTDRETLIFGAPEGEIAIGETYKPVYNDTGATIAKGTVVKAVGVFGEQFSIAPFDASAGVDDELYLIGVTQADILDDTSGIVVSEGYVKHLNTSAYSVGTVLYASETAGALTSTMPTSPNYGIPIAMVTKVDGTNGHIYVRPTFYPNIRDLHDVSSSAPVNLAVLQYNSTLSRYEPTVTPTFTSITSNTIVSASTLSLSDTGLNLVSLGSASFSGTVTCGGLTFNNDGTSIIAATGANPDDLEIRSNGNVSVLLDYDNNETLQTFTIKDSADNIRFLVREDGRISLNGITFPAGTGTQGQVIAVSATTSQLEYVTKTVTQITGKTVATGAWSVSGSFYKATISDSAILSTSIVDVIPDNASASVVSAAGMLPRTESATGTVDIYATSIPSATITVTLNVFNL